MGKAHSGHPEIDYPYTQTASSYTTTGILSIKNERMKTIHRNLIAPRPGNSMPALFRLLFLMSCTGCWVACESILDKEPIATLDAGSFFQSETDAVQALNAAYRPLLFNNRNGNFYWAFAEITGDNAITGGDGSRPGLVELDAFTYTPRTEEFNAFWKLQYEGITQCNLVLDNLDKIEMAADRSAQIRGEAMFLRAYYHFLLAQVFGDVPLLTRIIPPDQLRTPRTSKPEVLERIVRDCAEAADFLPQVVPPGQTGRATKGAALALAAKASLYNKNWSSVLDYVAQVKALGQYNLMPDYRDNFKKETQNNAESVWEIQHTNLELGVGNFLNQWWMSRKLNGYGFAELTASYYNSFEPGDPRRRFTAAANNEEYFGAIYKNSFSSTRYSPRKYLQDTAQVTQPADGDINYTAIRYAEVLLWEAEALIELNRLNEALEPLERVRARARAQAANPDTTLPPLTVGTQEAMRIALRRERNAELGFELHRFFDLVRWGIAQDVLPGFQPGKHEYLPIPQTEMDLNPALVQNPGY